MMRHQDKKDISFSAAKRKYLFGGAALVSAPFLSACGGGDPAIQELESEASTKMLGDTTVVKADTAANLQNIEPMSANFDRNKAQTLFNLVPFEKNSWAIEVIFNTTREVKVTLLVNDVEYIIAAKHKSLPLTEHIRYAHWPILSLPATNGYSGDPLGKLSVKVHHPELGNGNGVWIVRDANGYKAEPQYWDYQKFLTPNEHEWLFYESIHVFSNGEMREFFNGKPIIPSVEIRFIECNAEMLAAFSDSKTVTSIGNSASGGNQLVSFPRSHPLLEGQFTQHNAYIVSYPNSLGEPDSLSLPHHRRAQHVNKGSIRRHISPVIDSTQTRKEKYFAKRGFQEHMTQFAVAQVEEQKKANSPFFQFYTTSAIEIVEEISRGYFGKAYTTYLRGTADVVTKILSKSNFTQNKALYTFLDNHLPQVYTQEIKNHLARGLTESKFDPNLSDQPFGMFYSVGTASLQFGYSNMPPEALSTFDSFRTIFKGFGFRISFLLGRDVFSNPFKHENKLSQQYTVSNAQSYILSIVGIIKGPAASNVVGFTSLSADIELTVNLRIRADGRFRLEGITLDPVIDIASDVSKYMYWTWKAAMKALKPSANLPAQESGLETPISVRNSAQSSIETFANALAARMSPSPRDEGLSGIPPLSILNPEISDNISDIADSIDSSDGDTSTKASGDYQAFGIAEFSLFRITIPNGATRDLDANAGYGKVELLTPIYHPGFKALGGVRLSRQYKGDSRTHMVFGRIMFNWDNSGIFGSVESLASTGIPISG